MKFFLLQNDRRRDKDVTVFTMHDLVHDLARAILDDQVNDNGSVVGNRCLYAFLTDCSKPLQLSMTSPANIKVLHFLDCGKLELRGNAFSLGTRLCVLDLSECLVRKFPESVGQLKQLRFLCAPRIRDQMIPNCITKLSELNYLNLRGSHNLSALPESIGDMKGLMHLDLSGCHGIRKLPKSFAELKQLVHLDLSRCYMSISEAFGGLTELQYLDLSVQFIIVANRRGLTEVIGNLTKLRYLNLSGCMHAMAQSKDQIDSLLGSVSTLSNLEHLNLSENRGLSSIPESFGNLRKLHTLDLVGCSNIEKLPDSMFQIVNLKLLNVDNFVKSGLSWLNVALLPHFVVHPSSDKSSSNITLLQPTNPDMLTIDRLENVKSAEEAESIELIKKQKIKMLAFQWTVAAVRFVDDQEVLEKLVPPSSAQILSITGYRSVSIPDWFMDIGYYLPNLCKINLCDFPKCKSLPPLCQLPNLLEMGLYGMESLEEFNTAYTRGEGGANELMFPKLEALTVERCEKLRIQPCLPRDISVLMIIDCDNVLLSLGESLSHSAASSRPITDLTVCSSKVPLQQGAPRWYIGVGWLPDEVSRTTTDHPEAIGRTAPRPSGSHCCLSAYLACRDPTKEQQVDPHPICPIGDASARNASPGTPGKDSLNNQQDFWDETIKHLFLDCPLARVLWRRVHIAFNITPPDSVTTSFGTWLNGIEPDLARHIRVGVCALLWTIWTCRNDLVFNRTSRIHFVQVIFRATAVIRSWSLLTPMEAREHLVTGSIRWGVVARDIFNRFG
uniref:Putative disease resistance protein n=1 Tax=Aegilops tauschii TaxID=37682 RepID=M8C518_AEGTA